MKKILFSISFVFSSLLYCQRSQVVVVGPPQSDASIVLFSYDTAGNQVFRGPSGSVCTGCRDAESNITTSLADQLENKIHAAPVPVKTDLTIMWDLSIKDYIVKIELLPYNTFSILETVNVSSLSNNSYLFKMNRYNYGVYYIKFYLTDGSIYTRTITKN
ncbi:MAG: hypothetical protein L6262_11585 [Weeksellaceae bacterium]|nr:hypothetical protein [Weeksellaceae bacterium]